MLKLYLRPEMIVHNFREIIFFKQSKWLEKLKNSNTQKRSQAITDVEKDFYKLLSSSFYEKTIEILRNRKRIKFFHIIIVKKLSNNNAN